MDTVFLISKNFINNDEIIKSLETTAKQIGLVFITDNQNKYINLQFFKESEEELGYFEIALFVEEWFNQTKKDRSFIDGYGSKGSVDFDYDNQYLFKILHSLVDKFPTILIYNELGNASPKNPFIFSKAHFDIAKDLYSLNHSPLK